MTAVAVPDAVTKPMTKAETRAIREKSLLRAALVTVARYGIEGATVARICSEAGASRGLISHYFVSKDALLIAALQGLFDEAQTLKENIAADQSLPLTERIRGIAHSSFQAPVYSWEMAAAWQAFTNACRFTPLYLEPIQDSTEQFNDTVRLLFIALGDEQNLAVSPAAAARGLFILIDGLWNSLATGKDDMTPEEATQMCDVFISGCLQ
ncbi:TetR family transcriptional regulator [Aliamphritea ceti]|uniref:TetR family transcriptional regulator n=1 Tax=Aliamphritea ceti TaxID=1524258 RepID=UPI0021C2DD6A|nr:TetR family transcriptional regulator [Aliamphritea ceti]